MNDEPGDTAEAEISVASVAELPVKVDPNYTGEFYVVKAQHCIIICS